MRYILFIFLLFSLVHELYADENFLPESANPKTYKILSPCYGADDITFYTYGTPLGDIEDYKNMDLSPSGCFGGMGNSGFLYYDKTGNSPVTVFPDKKTLRIVSFGSGGYIGIDKKYLYLGTNAYFIPKGMDTTRIKRLNTTYFTDGTNLYSFYQAFDGHLSKSEGFDIPSLRIWQNGIGTDFLYDKNGFYIEEDAQAVKQNPDGTHIAKIFRKYSDFDLKTMTQSGEFLYDSRNIYTPYIKGVDRASFYPLDESFGVDKDHIYSHFGNIVSSINMKNFIYVGNGIFKSDGKLIQGCKYEVGCEGYVLKGFDIASFQVIPGGFADKNGYYDLNLNPMEKPKITYVGSSYVHDKKYVFMLEGGSPIFLTGAKIGSFSVFSGTTFAKDNSFCWSESKRFSCDPKTFQPLSGLYAYDKRNVYSQNKKIIGADPKSFTGILNTGGFNWIETSHYMQDKNHIYYDDRVIKDADPKTFELMKDLQSKDKKNIYYAGWKVEGVDYATYVPLRYSFARDKNHFYFAGISLAIIKNPKEVKIVTRDHIKYNGKTQYYGCFGSETTSIHPMCNE